LTLVREPLKRPLTPPETTVVTEAYGLKKMCGCSSVG
jgi:hypothetical protein